MTTKEIASLKPKPCGYALSIAANQLSLPSRKSEYITVPGASCPLPSGHRTSCPAREPSNTER